MVDEITCFLLAGPSSRAHRPPKSVLPHIWHESIRDVWHKRSHFRLLADQRFTILELPGTFYLDYSIGILIMV